MAHSRWGCALLALKHYDEAEQQLTRAYDALKPMPHPPSQLGEFRQALATLYTATGRPNRARALQAKVGAASTP